MCALAIAYTLGDSDTIFQRNAEKCHSKCASFCAK